VAPERSYRHMAFSCNNTCLHCITLEKWVTTKSVTKGSTGNLQKHLGQKHGIYKDQNTPLGITISIEIFRFLY
jgi:hypothetical protein